MTRHGATLVTTTTRLLTTTRTSEAGLETTQDWLGKYSDQWSALATIFLNMLDDAWAFSGDCLDALDQQDLDLMDQAMAHLQDFQDQVDRFTSSIG